MSEESSNPEKKLIIDEDWKSQVEAEKEAARKAEGPQQPATAASPGDSGPLPEANLAFLISTLYSQGMMGMGIVPNPITKKPALELDRARHAIDMLTMLQQKTEGNRTPDESADLEAALHELRMSYVAVSQSAG